MSRILLPNTSMLRNGHVKELIVEHIPIYSINISPSFSALNKVIPPTVSAFHPHPLMLIRFRVGIPDKTPASESKQRRPLAPVEMRGGLSSMEKINCSKDCCVAL
ncbi:hypothetical protein JTE90_029604 [Oedothorax gibbosus]|uniref:Uncharacterized protein n=1 Tax=Oedothorax gibbosus TaxID=931172 RepID=A0AAV6UTS4_9ARAC|nr:hypothetical protein JTE90_029604 [Oedothorax gibbosus]